MYVYMHACMFVCIIYHLLKSYHLLSELILHVSEHTKQKFNEAPVSSPTKEVENITITGMLVHQCIHRAMPVY